jgi:serine/threonine protein phosphatase PrpC
LDDGLGLVQLSKDQTLAMREVEAGRLSPEALTTDRRSSILLQCLGYGKMEPVFQCTKRPVQGAVLLCSDGLCHYTTRKELHGLLMETDSREQLQQAAGGGGILPQLRRDGQHHSTGTEMERPELSDVWYG